MTKMEIMIAFDLNDVEGKKLESLNGILREKVYKCDEEEYSSFCESMEEKGYYDVRLFPFCAKSDDEEDLKKALSWISDNSQLIKNLVEEIGVNIQLVIKFLVKSDSIFELFAGCPLELILSSDDLELLKDHNIDLKVTAEYASNNDDDDDNNDDDDDNNDDDDDNNDDENLTIESEDFVIDCGELLLYEGEDEDVVIPNGVTSIGRCALHCCDSIKTVSIPSGVTLIGNDAFSSSESLISVQIPDGVSKIGERAFDGCISLTRINIPESVTSIARYAFGWCDSLTDITLSNNVNDMGEDVFYGCEKLTIHAPAGSYAEQYAKENNIPFVAI